MIVLVLLAASPLLSGCSLGRSTGEIDATVTLSRNGAAGLGPTFSHVPQHGWGVSAQSTSGGTITASTDADGVARLTVPPGSYDVSADYCTGPQHVEVSAGSTVDLEFDCAAP